MARLETAVEQMAIRSGGMPQPVSLTVSRKVSPLFFSSTVTVPPAGVNFSALESR